MITSSELMHYKNRFQEENELIKLDKIGDEMLV